MSMYLNSMLWSHTFILFDIVGIAITKSRIQIKWHFLGLLLFDQSRIKNLQIIRNKKTFAHSFKINSIKFASFKVYFRRHDGLPQMRLYKNPKKNPTTNVHVWIKSRCIYLRLCIGNHFKLIIQYYLSVVKLQAKKFNQIGIRTVCSLDLMICAQFVQ